MRHERLRLVVSALAFAATLCAGCASIEGTSPASSDITVRTMLSTEPPSLALIAKPDSNTEALAVQITDSLVQYDPELRLVPRLAESWSFSDDGRTLTFRLRSGVQWHDGRPFTSADVLHTVDAVRRPELENRTYLPMFDDLESLEAPDETTVVARYRKATPDMLAGWRVPLVPRHATGPVGELLSGPFSKHPIGCGPFAFVRYRPGEEIVLEANDAYWDGRPQVDRLVFKIFREQRTAYQALLRGDLDLMIVGSVDLYDEAVSSGEDSRLAGTVYNRLVVWQLFWNLAATDGPLVDLRVRRALMRALDREGFNDALIHGLARIAATPIPPGTAWAAPDVQPLGYDPERARRLLDEAGWIDRDGDGVRERGGRAFAVTLLAHTSSQKLLKHIAEWIQKSWSEVGVDTEIEMLEWTHYRERRNAGSFDVAMQSINMSDPDLSTMLRTGGPMNYGGFSDAEVDRLLAAVRETFDPDLRLEALHRLQRRLLEEQPMGWLFHFPSPLLHDRRIRGIRTSPLGYLTHTEGPRTWRWVESGPEGG